jgi:hypothetical protein
MARVELTTIDDFIDPERAPEASVCLSFRGPTWNLAKIVEQIDEIESVAAGFGLTATRETSRRGRRFLTLVRFSGDVDGVLHFRQLVESARAA